jgi:outer membrane protein
VFVGRKVTDDVFGTDHLRNLFAGFYVHHRSGIFASANLYGNVYGGSNVNALYLEWEFER